VADLEGSAAVAVEAAADGEVPLEDEPAPLVFAAPVPEKKQPDLFIDEDNVFGTATEDARRRDFTINGLFYDPGVGKVIDHVRGLRDLGLKEIRTIGDPEVRMREDPVRLLRGVRFACKPTRRWKQRSRISRAARLPACSRRPFG
jgi:hypothetical protein